MTKQRYQEIKSQMTAAAATSGQTFDWFADIFGPMEAVEASLTEQERTEYTRLAYAHMALDNPVGYNGISESDKIDAVKLIAEQGW